MRGPVSVPGVGAVPVPCAGRGLSLGAGAGAGPVRSAARRAGEGRGGSYGRAMCARPSGPRAGTYHRARRGRESPGPAAAPARQRLLSPPRTGDSAAFATRVWLSRRRLRHLLTPLHPWHPYLVTAMAAPKMAPPSILLRWGPAELFF